MVVFWQILAKLVVFGQKRFYSEKVVVLGQKWLYSVKIGCNRENWLYSVKSCCYARIQPLYANTTTLPENNHLV